VKIFIVEDAVEVRKRLVAMVSAVPGVKVVGEAATVREAIDGAAAAAPDVMLLDLQLADGNGLDVLAGLKARLPRLRTIVLSNFATPQHRAASLAAGAARFFDKSAEFGRVAGVLREWGAATPTGATC
jgi:DNA-binding NarL/FixJ family response regulator